MLYLSTLHRPSPWLQGQLRARRDFVLFMALRPLPVLGQGLASSCHLENVCPVNTLGRPLSSIHSSDQQTKTPFSFTSRDTCAPFSVSPRPHGWGLG